MGVVYKITPEVVTFIIEQKRKTPALGCRDIAKIASQEFHYPVSKSSINNVIQQFHLSNPIGRRSLSGTQSRGKKFEIPAEQKHRIFSSLPAGDPHISEKNGSPEEDRKKAVLPENKTAIVKREQDKSVPKNVLSYAGSIFLRAIQWELPQGSILGRFLQEQIKDVPPEGLFRLSDALIVAHAIEEKSHKEVFEEQKDLFNLLYGPSLHELSERISEKIDEIMSSEAMAVKFMVDLPAMVSLVSKIRFELENGDFFILDAKQLTVWKENIQFGHFILLEKTLERIITEYLNNVQTAVFSTIPTEDFSGTEKFKDEFYALLFAFENISGKRMIKISLHTAEGQEIVGLDTIPEKKRVFVAGLWPWQTKFSGLLTQANLSGKPPKKLDLGVAFGALKENCDFYFHETEFSFTEDQSSMPKILGRAVFLYDSVNGPPLGAILTNASGEQLSAKAVALSYLSRWPELGASLSIQMLKNIENLQNNEGPGEEIEKNSPEEIYYKKMTEKADDIIADILLNYSISSTYDKMSHVEYLKELYVRLLLIKFFPRMDLAKAKNMIQDIFNLSGQVFIEKNQIKLNFFLPAGKPFLYRDQLDFAIQVFNEEGIRDEKACKIILGLA